MVSLKDTKPQFIYTLPIGEYTGSVGLPFLCPNILFFLKYESRQFTVLINPFKH